MKILIKLIAVIVLILSLLAIPVGFMDIEEGEQEAQKTSSVASETDAEESTQEPSEEEEKAVYEDKMLKVTYLGYMREGELHFIAYDYMNKTKKQLTVYPNDAVIDNRTVLLTSGMPATIEPKTSYRQVYTAPIKPRKRIKMRLSIDDENFNTIKVTKIFQTDIRK